MSDRDTARRPIKEKYFYGIIYRCPECSKQIGHGFYNEKYCPECGQKIDWKAKWWNETILTEDR